jgi:uncharacterized protein (DUF2336 family)
MAVAFEALKDLARERSRDKRNELLRAITETFFDSPAHSEIEIDLFDEIMDMVLADVEPMARRELAERLSYLTQAPRRTLLRLAGDEIEIAGPLLTRSPALADDDLEPICREHTQYHLLAIAGRSVLSERLTDILVERGNDNVAGTVTANPGALLSEFGFSALAGRARDNEAILNSLVMRSDLPERVATDLLPILGTSIAGKIATLDVDFGPAVAKTLVGEAWMLLSERLRTSPRESRPLAVLREMVDRGQSTFAEAIIELADGDQLVELAAYIGLKLDLKSHTVVRSLFAANEEPTMLMCRAARLDINAFSAMLRMRARRKRGIPAQPVELLKEYLALSREVAENVVSAVRAREGAGSDS